MKKQLIRIKKIFLRSVLYLIDPERCVPRVIHYNGKDYYLSEITNPTSSGVEETIVSYFEFVNNEQVSLIELSHFNRGSAYRAMHRSLWKLGVF